MSTDRSNTRKNIFVILSIGRSAAWTDELFVDLGNVNRGNLDDLAWDGRLHGQTLSTIAQILFTVVGTCKLGCVVSCPDGCDDEGQLKEA